MTETSDASTLAARTRRAHTPVRSRHNWQRVGLGTIMALSAAIVLSPLAAQASTARPTHAPRLGTPTLVGRIARRSGERVSVTEPGVRALLSLDLPSGAAARHIVHGRGTLKVGDYVAVWLSSDRKVIRVRFATYPIGRARIHLRGVLKDASHGSQVTLSVAAPHAHPVTLFLTPRTAVFSGKQRVSLKDLRPGSAVAVGGALYGNTVVCGSIHILTALRRGRNSK